MSRIEVISSSLVGMSSDAAAAAAASMSRLELSAFDVRLLLLVHIQRALFFHKPPSQNIIPHLKNSLSRALGLFPPLAGRLATTDNDDGTTTFFVDCNNAGVQFTHAVAAAFSVSDILDQQYVPDEIVSSFFVMNGMLNYEGVSKPLMGVQVTDLADGHVIAFTANHVVVDGISFWHFVNSWSEISRGLDTISKSPVFEPWFPTDDSCPLRLPPLEKDLSRRFVPPLLLVCVFHFSKESLAKLKAKANSEAGTDKISSLQALSAHLWRSYARCRGLSPSGGELHLAMAVGARSRMPLPDGYFGNASYAARTTISEGELLQRGLGSVALKVHETVAAQNKETAVKVTEEWMRNPMLPEMVSSNFLIAGSHRHNVYGNDFGWGKPIAVRTGEAQRFDGTVAVFPAAEDGGIDAEVCLTPDVLQAMECDAEFMEAFIV